MLESMFAPELQPATASAVMSSPELNAPAGTEIVRSANGGGCEPASGMPAATPEADALPPQPAGAVETSATAAAEPVSSAHQSSYNVGAQLQLDPATGTAPVSHVVPAPGVPVGDDIGSRHRAEANADVAADIMSEGQGKVPGQPEPGNQFPGFAPDLAGASMHGLGDPGASVTSRSEGFTAREVSVNEPSGRAGSGLSGMFELGAGDKAPAVMAKLLSAGEAFSALQSPERLLPQSRARRQRNRDRLADAGNAAPGAQHQSIKEGHDPAAQAASFDDDSHEGPERDLEDQRLDTDGKAVLWPP